MTIGLEILVEMFFWVISETLAARRSETSPNIPPTERTGQ